MTLYTVITNRCDRLLDPVVVSAGWKYVCFTDDPKLKSGLWDVRLLNGDHNRHVKINGHKYLSGQTIYIDANILVLSNLNKLMETVNLVFTVPKHPARDCAYMEAAKVVDRHMADPVQVFYQMAKYANDGFPRNFGLGQNSILIRDFSNPKVKELNEYWYDEFVQGAPRDQLSLMYCLWKLNWVDYSIMQDASKYFRVLPHNSVGTIHTRLPRALRTKR